jgi:hypothetical protein
MVSAGPALCNFGQDKVNGFARGAGHNCSRLTSFDFRDGVNLVTLTVRRSLPVYPDKQTSSEPVGMSQRCQSTKSLRDSPLRGSKSRGAGSR